MGVSEERELTFKLDMPLEFDEDVFRQSAHAAVAKITRDLGGHIRGHSMNHGVVSRAEHYAAIARELLGR